MSVSVMFVAGGGCGGGMHWMECSEMHCLKMKLKMHFDFAHTPDQPLDNNNNKLVSPSNENAPLVQNE
jgi:hypothetical protein